MIVNFLLILFSKKNLLKNMTTKFLLYNSIEPLNLDTINDILPYHKKKINIHNETFINLSINQIKQNMLNNTFDNCIYIRFYEFLYIFNRYDIELINIIETKPRQNNFIIIELHEILMNDKYFYIKTSSLYNTNNDNLFQHVSLLNNNFYYCEDIFFDKDVIIKDLIQKINVHQIIQIILFVIILVLILIIEYFK